MKNITVKLKKEHQVNGIPNDCQGWVQAYLPFIETKTQHECAKAVVAFDCGEIRAINVNYLELL